MSRIFDVTTNTLVALVDAVKRTAAGTTNNAALDVRDFDGKGRVVLMAQSTESADDTLDVKIQESADGSTGWADTGIAFTQVTNAAALLESKDIDFNEREGFLRAVDTVAGAGPAVNFGVQLIGFKP